MYLLVTDETNLEPSATGKFFIYGGLFLRMDALPKLTELISLIREGAGYRPEDKLKFDTTARPSHVSIKETTDAKRATIDACLQLDCRFIVNVVLHAIAHAETAERRVTYGMNSVLGRFHKFLEQQNEYGMVIADTLPIANPNAYLQEKFGQGLVFQKGKPLPLDRICMYAMSSINASHISSAVDIVLGSFRYCINNPKNEDAAREMLPKVVHMMWHDLEGDEYQVLSKGMVVRPKRNNIASPAYKAEYDGLLQRINSLLDDNKEQSP